jgi:hypothetical protein
VRIGQTAGHILEIGAQLGGNVMRGIARAHGVEVFRAALLVT